jgi:hypothetical protein
MDLAAKPPHWSAPVFKTALSHVPDIQRTKAMMYRGCTVAHASFSPVLFFATLQYMDYWGYMFIVW